MPSTNTAPQPCASPRLYASVHKCHLKARYTVSHPHTVSCQERTCDVSIPLYISKARYTVSHPHTVSCQERTCDVSIPSYMYTVACPGSLCASHCCSKRLSVLPEICPNTGGVFSPALNRSIAVTVQPENVERNQLFNCCSLPVHSQSHCDQKHPYNYSSLLQASRV